MAVAKLARLEWIAAINPASAGIAAAESDGLIIQTVNLLLARTRGPMPPRFAEIVHRSIPQPVILIHADEAPEAPASLSLAPKRAAEREAGRVVVTTLHDTGLLSGADRPFIATLALGQLPTRDLATLYAGLIDRTEALAAARKVGRPFRLASSAVEQQAWQEALERCRVLETEMATLVASMRKQTRLALRVELGEKVRLLKDSLDNWRSGLE